MIKFLLSLSIFFTSAAQAAEKAGMPQLDPTTWFPQVFWLLITFGFLYLIVEKIVFPRLSDSIEQRNDHVSDNIDEANSIKDQAEKEGLDKIFIEAGFEWREPGCSMCLAMNADKLNPKERCASTSNRNFEGRQGRGGRTHLVSPAMAVAAAINGCLTDVRKFS